MLPELVGRIVRLVDAEAAMSFARENAGTLVQYLLFEVDVEKVRVSGLIFGSDSLDHAKLKG